MLSLHATTATTTTTGAGVVTIEQNTSGSSSCCALLRVATEKGCDQLVFLFAWRLFDGLFVRVFVVVGGQKGTSSTTASFAA